MGSGEKQTGQNHDIADIEESAAKGDQLSLQGIQGKTGNGTGTGQAENGGIDREQVEFMQEYLPGRGLKDERDEELDKAGLSLVGYHINAMSGKLEINSELGRGTEFVITVPQLQAG